MMSEHILYEPTGYHSEELRRHGQIIAVRLALTEEQIRVLVPELRNALALAAMAVGLECRVEELRLSAEDVLDVRRTMYRLLAVADALVETTTKTK